MQKEPQKCGSLRFSLITGSTIVIRHTVGHIQINAGTGIIHGMHLTLLVLLGGGFRLFVRLTGNKNHAKAQAECQKKAENALFHFLHSSFRAFWEFFKVIVSKKEPFVNTFSAFSSALFIFFKGTLKKSEKV
jgi:hypothetical protein